MMIFISTHATFVFSEEWPVQIVGEWQIVEVHLNTEASRTPLYQWNDPRLVGRFFRFGRQIVWNDTPEQSECTTPTVRTLSMNPEDLIGHSLARYGYPPQYPNPGDYRISLGGSGSRSVFRIYCGQKLWQGGLGADIGLKGAWIVQSDDPSQLLLRWYDETIVVLKKVKSDLPISASFDCSKSKNFTEKSICGSRELASFDRSIAIAYKQFLAQNNDEAKSKNNLINDQRLWMIKRNACKSNENCILRIMRSRLEFLSVQDSK